MKGFFSLEDYQYCHVIFMIRSKLRCDKHIFISNYLLLIDFITQYIDVELLLKKF